MRRWGTGAWWRAKWACRAIESEGACGGMPPKNGLCELRINGGEQMKISDALLPEFDQEMANTRKTLERIPEDKLGWKPHEKSMTLGRLAGHVAEMPGWAPPTISQDSLDIAPADSPSQQGLTATSRDQALV